MTVTFFFIFFLKFQGKNTFPLELGRLAIGGIVINEILRRQVMWVDDDRSHDILFIAGIAIGFLSLLVSLILGIKEIKTDKMAKHTPTHNVLPSPKRSWHKKRRKK